MTDVCISDGYPLLFPLMKLLSSTGLNIILGLNIHPQLSCILPRCIDYRLYDTRGLLLEFRAHVWHGSCAGTLDVTVASRCRLSGKPLPVAPLQPAPSVSASELARSGRAR